ncbi:MAG: TMEM175 family protein [Rhizobiaceae bacterium]
MSESYENDRLVLFSDAVIAITITLMMLEIRLPPGAAELPDAQLWTALTELWPRYLAYIVSFLVVGSFWAVHHRKFRTIVRSSGGLIWLNLVFLLAIGFVPFATDLLAESGGRLATVLYAAVVTVIALLSATMTLYAARAGLTREPIEGWRAVLPSLGAAAVFVVSIPIALVDPDLGKYFWLALVPVNIVVDRLAGRNA